MTGSRPTRRPRNGSRRGAPDPGALARLTAARDNLDADLAAARLREDELLAEYVTIEATAAEVTTRRDTALAELDRKAQAVRAEADDALAAVEARRGEVLMRLSQRRSAEELHALVGLPLRRIRRVLQMHRQPADGDPAGVQAVAGRSPGRGRLAGRGRHKAPDGAEVRPRGRGIAGLGPANRRARRPVVVGHRERVGRGGKRAALTRGW